MIFHKLSVLGNNFIVVVDIPSLSKKRVKELCSSELGIGGDGVLLVNIKNSFFPKLTIYNHDGSLAKMCGNGLKAIAYFLRNMINYRPLPLTIITDSGKKVIGYEKCLYYMEGAIPKIISPSNQEKMPFAIINAGNKHAIMLVDEISAAELLGDIKTYQLDDINISYMKKIKEHEYQILTYERGVGFTASCGSAALSAYALLKSKGYNHHLLTLVSRGGRQKIEEKMGVLRLSSKVKYCYKGEYYGYE